MKDTILFKLGSMFICMTALGSVVAIPDTEDNRNPDRGPLTRMGVNAFETKERTAPTVLTGENLAAVVKQLTESIGSILEPVMNRLKALESQNESLEQRFKMSFDAAETKKAEKLLSSEPRTLVNE